MEEEKRVITWEEYSQHISSKDCWVLIDQEVYNVSDFLVQHPGGNDILIKNARHVGSIQAIQCPEAVSKSVADKKAAYQKKQQQSAKKRRVYRDGIPRKEVRMHRSQQDCWIIINGKVYDATSYLDDHPGGASKIMEWAGRDAGKAFFDQGHSVDALKKRDQLIIGSIASENTTAFIVFGIILMFAAAFLYWHYF